MNVLLVQSSLPVDKNFLTQALLWAKPLVSKQKKK